MEFNKPCIYNKYINQKNQYEIGSTGFVKLLDTTVEKYMSVDNCAWFRELSIMTYLKKIKHPNLSNLNDYSFSLIDSTDIANIKSIYDIDIKPDDLFCGLVYDKIFVNGRLVYCDKDIVLLQYIIDILSAVSCLHHYGIIHRDLKRDNIMITDKNRAVVIDFSHSVHNILVKKLDKSVVTYTHRAPEVNKYIDNIINTYDEKIDIWSIGIILLELTCNKSIIGLIASKSCVLRSNSVEKYFYEYFQHDNYIERLRKIYEKNTSYVHKLIYWNWIKKMLAYNHLDRPSAMELLCEIVHFCESNNISINKPYECDYNPVLHDYTYIKPISNAITIVIDACIKSCVVDEMRDVIFYYINNVINTNLDTNNDYMKYIRSNINSSRTCQICTSMATILLVASYRYDVLFRIDDIVLLVEKHKITKKLITDYIIVLASYYCKYL